MNLRGIRLLGVGVALVVFIAACGGGASPSSPIPTRPPALPPPVATALPSPTTVPPLAPTPTPAAGVQEPTKLAGKRGGVLQLSINPSYLTVTDTFSSSGNAAVPHQHPFLNNLILPDPYNPQKLVGDVAERWEFSEGGRVVTFRLRKGIKFHDGTPLTSTDVAYNIQRGWQPRTPRMNGFQGRFKSLLQIETPDEATVRLTLSDPSNFFQQSLASASFLIYPAHFPFPEREEVWKQAPIGSGPFRVKGQEGTVKVEYVRNDGYWKSGLPYLDGITMTSMVGPTVLAGFRTGRLDSTSLDFNFIENDTDVLVKEQGFIRYPINAGVYGPHINQRPPWTNPLAREALSLATDRQAVLDLWLHGKGTAFASPLVPPELGGQWGLSTEVMKTRPGFRPDKTADLARAKELLAQAGVNPDAFTVQILVSDALGPGLPEAAEASVRSLGFRTKLEVGPSAQQQEQSRGGNFDLLWLTLSIGGDDPFDHLAPFVLTGGSQNFGKWSNPQLDALFTEQDHTLDAARRRQLLLELQEIVLRDNAQILAVWRQPFAGHQPWVKNYPGKLPFAFSPRYRFEQVYIDKA